MKKLMCALLCLTIISGLSAMAEDPEAPSAPVTKANTKAQTQNNDDMLFAGNLYFAPQNWSKVGDGQDSKIGFGMGGMFGFGMRLDDMTLSVGPHFASSSWSADYSQKFESATKSVFVNIQDAGMEFIMAFDDMQIIFGAGSATLDAGMVLDTGETIMYPGLEEAKSNYTTVGFGLKLDSFYIAPVIVNYSGTANDADRVEFRCGMTL